MCVLASCCDDKLTTRCVSRVVCVMWMMWRRRAAGGGGVQEKAGVQNQKQEPHTKMWGKSCILELCPIDTPMSMSTQ